MNRIEQQLLSLIKENDRNYSIQAEHQILDRFQDMPLGSATDEFMGHPTFRTFVEESELDTVKYFNVWFRMNEYLRYRCDSRLTHQKLKDVEEALQISIETMTRQAKACGVAMLPMGLTNPKFINQLYSLKDNQLIQLYLQYYPEPKHAVFQEQCVPEDIVKKHQHSTDVILNFLKKHEPLAYVEKKVMTIQREFRARKRKRENYARLPQRYCALLKQLSDYSAERFTQELLADANQPYQPQCDPVLAKRIMQAAKKVTLFSTVTHLTAASAIESIFNDALYGRRSLIQQHKSFRPASLFPSDIKEGDGDVICLGAQNIDPSARHGIELQFDAKKIASNNPCIFFKQRDFGFDPQTIRSITIGDISWHFSHTGTYRHQPGDCSSFVLYTADGQSKHAVSNVTKAALICDNIKQIHNILTLNFFRFIDTLMTLDSCERVISENIADKQAMYTQLSQLNDEELVETLHDIGKKISDTMEFNFYGSYRIEFEALLSITNQEWAYTLNMASFIKELKAGNLDMYYDASVHLPELFKSYRFIDFLLSTTSHETVVGVLQEQRIFCALPAWEAQQPSYSY